MFEMDPAEAVSQLKSSLEHLAYLIEDLQGPVNAKDADPLDVSSIVDVLLGLDVCSLVRCQHCFVLFSP